MTDDPHLGEAPTSAPATAPPTRNTPPTWSGRRTAVVAALAIGISSMGAIGAAAALPSGSAAGDRGQLQQRGFAPGGQQGRFGPNHQGAPNQQGIPNADPNAGRP